MDSLEVTSTSRIYCHSKKLSSCSSFVLIALIIPFFLVLCTVIQDIHAVSEHQDLFLAAFLAFSLLFILFHPQDEVLMFEEV